ncbi:uncharacterized protein LOC141598963 [Silene latifolia]|uniref:uncharacterized protein LOC141598963 n=1 Tax=Silene latifolia TaxID=37657 RepID=UPI003D78101A
MDPPLPPTQTTTVPTTTYPDSTDSPRSRADLDPLQPTTKLRLMCSYGGHIIPRPHDKSLCYVGGDTRMVVIPRTSTLPDLLSRLSKTLINSPLPHQHHHQHPFTLKYQLPHEDLDSLITVSTDEDLDNMIDEYDRLSALKSKSGRIRLFLFPSPSLDSTQSMGPILDGSNRSEDWFLNALNSAAELQRGFSEPGSISNLLGLDQEVEFVNPSSNININNINNKSTNDLQSVPDSPMVETTSSFGSTSSQPSFLNLAPIRVHVDDGNGRFVDQRSGIEEQFAQLGMGGGGGGGGGIQLNKQGEDGFVAISSSPSVAMMAAGGGGGGGGGGEFGNRNYSEDDRSDHGYRKQQQVTGQGQGQQQQQQQQMMGQNQQTGGDLPSPDSVSSDNSLSSANARQKPGMYQDSNSQLSSGSNRPSQGMQVQVSDSGYVYHPQYEQHQRHMLQQHQHQQQQQQQHHQQQQLHLLQQQQHQQQQQGQTHQQPQQQPQQQAQQQYLPPGAHYVQHHPQGSVPMQGYYPMYQPQQQNLQQQQQQYPVYYVQAGQAQGYSLPGQQQQPQQQQQQQQQQPNRGEGPTSVTTSRTQTQPNPSYNQARNMNVNMNMPPPKSEVGPGMYRTNTAAGGGMVQVVSNQQQPPPKSQPQQQQQYMGYSQPHHPSQSIAPNPGAASGYAYDFADPPRSQIYYTQPLQPALASQYQGGTSGGPTMMMPDGSSQPSSDNGK